MKFLRRSAQSDLDVIEAAEDVIERAPRKATRVFTKNGIHYPYRTLSGTKILAPIEDRHQAWTELVKPGPKGDPAKREARLARRILGTFTDEPQTIPRRFRRQGPIATAGRLVLHKRTASIPARDERRDDDRPKLHGSPARRERAAAERG